MSISFKSININGAGSGTKLKDFWSITKSTYHALYYYDGDSLLNIFDVNDTENVTDFEGMFYGCSTFTEFPCMNTSNATSLKYLYNGCKNGKIFPVLDTPNVTDFNGIYTSCVSVEYLPQINTIKGANFASMFGACNKLLKSDITRFSCSGSTSLCANMFGGCYSIRTIIFRSFASSYMIPSGWLAGCYHIVGTTNATYNPSGSKDGYIYVPRDMIETLSTATNWSEYASQLRALEDYTKDGTTTGEFDDMRANKDYYVVPLTDTGFIEPGTKTLSITLNEFTNIPTVSITSDNEEVVTISNINPTTSEITFDVNILGVEGNANISVSVSGDASNEFTFNVAYGNYTEPTYSIEAVNGVTYGFELNSNEYYESTNKGISNSYSLCKVLINNPNFDGIAKMTLTCINYAENNYDYGILSNIDTTLTLSYAADSSNVYKSFKGLNKSTEQEVVYDLPNGEHYVYVKFIKDSSSNIGNDSLQFKVSFGV